MSELSGYRVLSGAEIAMINRVKDAERVALQAVKDAQEFIAAQEKALLDCGDEGMLAEMKKAEPQRCAALAKTELQAGFMWLVRAVAQPRQ